MGADPDAAYDGFVAWAGDQGLALYPAQDEAAIEIVSGANVILSTPTGTGKSLVAIAAHAASLARGGRTYYTAPIKALVSEKFFALVDIFGAEDVGMVTGDSSVNPDAPIICCTAEILANLALRQGSDAAVDQVVMDEFHYYGDPDRGWAWQVPLLLLPRAQFVLMSATLGDVSDIAADLSRRTGRPTAVITGVERPVPLHFSYARTPVHETVEELLETGQAPVYIVHFSQAAAMERAQALSSVRIVSREQRDAIAEAIGGFRFTTAFGRTLSRYVRAGIGVHHAGMLPRYRRLVETLAQRGLLRVICGTDTLGVGINVPIRTVLITALAKYDGQRMRQLTAREFHQVAGRAGRAGYDTAGTVVVMAPEHEIENSAAVAKAGDDPKKLRKIVRKKAPQGFVNWGEASFERLVAAEPEPLEPHLQLTAAMLINVIARGGDVFANVRSLVFDNHESRARRYELARRALGIFRTLVAAGVVVADPPASHPRRAAARCRFGGVDSDSEWQLAHERAADHPAHGRPAAELRPESAAVAVRARRHRPAGPGRCPGCRGHRPLRARRGQRHRGDPGRPASGAVAAAVPRTRRGGGRDEARGPRVRPAHGAARGDHLPEAARRAARAVLRGVRIEPAVGARLRALAEVGRARHVRAGPVVLRDDPGLPALAQRGPRAALPQRRVSRDPPDGADGRADAGAARHHRVARRTRAAGRLQPRRRVGEPDPPGAVDPGEEVVPPAPPSVLTNRRAFLVLVRNELFRRVRLAALQRDDELAELDPDVDWSAALDAYFDEHDDILTGGAARSPRLVTVDETDVAASGVWRVEQTIDDPAGDHDWRIRGEVDLAASEEEGTAVVRITEVLRL